MGIDEDFDGVESLGRDITPESVVAYVCSAAAELRLSDLGLRYLHTADATKSVGIALTYVSGKMNFIRCQPGKQI